MPATMNRMPRLRVSAISYLNTAPLMWNFEHGSERAELQRRFQVDYTIPAHCAQMLADGAADIGIIPVAAYATIRNLVILPDVAIASKDAVRSILLISKAPLERIGSVALDSSSRSSAALVQVLFARHWKQEAKFVPAEPQLESMLANNDAALLIGDPALKVDRSRYLTWDLAHEWRAFSGRPFVFAFWAVRGGVASEDDLAGVAEVFRASRDAGMTHVCDIATDWSTKLELSPEFIASYLTKNIEYSLTPENVSGMQLFFELAAELKLLPRAPELRFARELEVRNSGLRNRF
jgi:chorismate dehydratase